MNEIELGKQLGFNVHYISCWNHPRLEMPGFKKDFSFLFLKKVKSRKEAGFGEICKEKMWLK